MTCRACVKDKADKIAQLSIMYKSYMEIEPPPVPLSSIEQDWIEIMNYKCPECDKNNCDHVYVSLSSVVDYKLKHWDKCIKCGRPQQSINNKG